MTGFNIVFRIRRDLPMLIWECGRFLESLGAGRPLAQCGSSVGSKDAQAPTQSQIVNRKVDAGRADFPGSAYSVLARLSVGMHAAVVGPEASGCPSRRFLNTDNSSFLALRVWSLLVFCVGTSPHDCLKGTI